MTNLDIIVNEAIANEIFSEEQVVEYFETIGCLPLFTFAEWKKKGYFVKKGEKAKMTCYIWKMKNKKVTVPMKEGDDVEVDERNFYKVKAFFFGMEQVEKIAVKVGA